MREAATRRRGVRIAAVLAATAAVLGAAPARAQSDDDDDHGVLERGSAAAPTTLLPRTRPCALEPFYERAVHLLAVGQYEEAEDLLERVITTCPLHPFAAEMLRVATLEDDYADAHGRPETPPAPTGLPTSSSLHAPERREPLSRAELVVTESVFGAVHGGGLCGTFVLAASGGFVACSGAAAGGAIFVGAALGAGLAFFGSWDGVRPGQAQAIEAGTFWGSWNGLWLGLLAAPPSSSGASPALDLGFGFHGGMIVGTAAGAVIAVLAPPRGGQVAFLNSGGLWGGVIGLMLVFAGAGFSGPTAQQIGIGQLVGVNAGLAAAGIASGFYPTSRWRMAFVDLAAALGLATGAGLGALIATGANGEASIVGISAGLGTAIGFGIGLGLTHAMDHPDRPGAPPPIRTSFLPIDPAGRPGLTLGATF